MLACAHVACVGQRIAITASTNHELRSPPPLTTLAVQPRICGHLLRKSCSIAWATPMRRRAAWSRRCS